MTADNESKENSSDNNVKPPIPADEFDGGDLYPERRGGTYKRNWFKTIIGYEGREEIAKTKCERNVYNNIKNSPLVQLMLGALKSSGCEFDFSRHVSCEMCSVKVSGGYDPELNQIVICQNVARSKEMVQGVLVHEMIHMFDYCRNKLDFKNIDHLACTEIRAANLAHCGFLSACTEGQASFINIREAHQKCVKNKAMLSVLAVRKISQEEAMAAVERVFPKCYKDLEPIGRRLRRNSHDMHKAFMEGPYYGYEL
ncbi:mitochondrial inner membrane protease ATP23 homolog [Orussus abietinus]|uniref:mitochondrial inner membrane protease ATP23 homolog n=1 Tax=Orussus abietinus TaxID=222816 RepID=UPI0006260A2F|nr:mitochondrial inner membrane protease ATP23 homolog [Orussus abietinus]XP_012272587.1 mitochondrial inner membrane protease ATP23 homolog [Orussus abietinus]